MNHELRYMVETAVTTGDAGLLFKALEIAAENDARNGAIEEKRREAAVEALRVAARPVSRYKIVTLAGTRGSRFVVTEVSYASGSGYKVSKFRSIMLRNDADRAKGMQMSTTAAEGVAEYLTRHGYRGVGIEAGTK